MHFSGRKYSMSGIKRIKTRRHQAVQDVYDAQELTSNRTEEDNRSYGKWYSTIFHCIFKKNYSFSVRVHVELNLVLCSSWTII